MSVQFRQRTPAEYLKILKRRKWLIILPVIAVATAVSYVVYKLPDVYESSTLIVVKPSTLPQSTGQESPKIPPPRSRWRKVASIAWYGAHIQR